MNGATACSPLPSIDIIKIATSLPWNSSCAFCTEGISATQVCHHVAQKRTTTTLPWREVKAREAPWESGNEKAGAGRCWFGGSGRKVSSAGATVAVARSPHTNRPLSMIMHVGGILSTAISFQALVEAVMATSIDNAGEERNGCFDRRLPWWQWCRADQKVCRLTTGPSDGACLAHPPAQPAPARLQRS
jgi:hypothetical protein